MSAKTAILTDSNSGITQNQARDLGVYVIPMPFTIDGKDYFEEINLSQNEFYEMLLNGGDISTSQPNPQSLMDKWDELLKDYDDIVYIPMSSGLSGSYQTAKMLSNDYSGKVYVVNNQRISVTMRQSVLDAIKLSNEGFSAKEIAAKLEEDKFNSSIYIMVNTLDYLKKGGRITPAVAVLGTLLKIKPVLQIQGEKLDTFSKVRTLSQAKAVMVSQVEKDIVTRFDGKADGEGVNIEVAYTYDKAVADEFLAEVRQKFPKAELYEDSLSLSVSCHIGPGALALAVTKKSF